MAEGRPPSRLPLEPLKPLKSELVSAKGWIRRSLKRGERENAANADNDGRKCLLLSFPRIGSFFSNLHLTVYPIALGSRLACVRNLHESTTKQQFAPLSSAALAVGRFCMRNLSQTHNDRQLGGGRPTCG